MFDGKWLEGHLREGKQAHITLYKSCLKQPTHCSHQLSLQEEEQEFEKKTERKRLKTKKFSNLHIQGVSKKSWQLEKVCQCKECLMFK